MNAIAASPRQDTRASLIDAALACFAQYGYDATSIRLVASMAGKNSSLISYYFKSKEGLYRAVILDLLDRFDTQLPEPFRSGAIDPPLPPDLAVRNLRVLIAWILREVDRHFNVADPRRDQTIRLFLAELRNPKEEVRDVLRDRLKPSVDAMRACIRGLRPDLDPADVDFWGTTLHGCCVSHAMMAEINNLVWTEADPSLTIESMADRLTGFASRGLALA